MWSANIKTIHIPAQQRQVHCSWFVKQIGYKTQMPTRILKLQAPSHSFTKKYM